MSVLQQKNIPWLGAVVDSFFTAAPFLSIWNFVAIQAVLYTSVIHYILPILPWFHFVWFLLIMSTFAGVAIFIVYKFVIRSLWSWRETQLYGSKSVVMKQLEALRSEVEGLKKEFEEFNKARQD